MEVFYFLRPLRKIANELLSTTEAVVTGMVGCFVLRSWIVWRFGERKREK